MASVENTATINQLSIGSSGATSSNREKTANETPITARHLKINIANNFIAAGRNR